MFILVIPHCPVTAGITGASRQLLFLPGILTNKPGVLWLGVLNYRRMSVNFPWKHKCIPNKRLIIELSSPLTSALLFEKWS